MRVAVLEGYRMWADTYDRSPNPLLELESAILPQYFVPLAGKMFADIGCGTGRWAQYARRRGARVMAIDLSHEMLLQAAAKLELSGSLIRADAAALPSPDRAIDVSVCSFTIAYLVSLTQFAAEVSRIARPGSRVVISDLHPAAMKAGWKRTFRWSNQTYELEHSIYNERQILSAFAVAGLSLDHRVEAHIGEAQFETFRRAGKESAFAEACRTPALWIGIWRKP